MPGVWLFCLSRRMEAPFAVLDLGKSPQKRGRKRLPRPGWLHRFCRTSRSPPMDLARLSARAETIACFAFASFGTLAQSSKGLDLAPFGKPPRRPGGRPPAGRLSMRLPQHCPLIDRWGHLELLSQTQKPAFAAFSFLALPTGSRTLDLIIPPRDRLQWPRPPLPLGFQVGEVPWGPEVRFGSSGIFWPRCPLE